MDIIEYLIAEIWYLKKYIKNVIILYIKQDLYQ